MTTREPSVQGDVTASQVTRPVGSTVRRFERLAQRLVTAVRRATSANEAALILVLIAVCIGFGLKNELFWSLANLEDIARATSFMLIVAVGTTFVLVSGTLDLSIGAVYGLGGVATGLALVHGVPVVAAILVGLAAGAAIGLLNGLIVVRAKVPALIATLGTLYAVRGLVYVLTSGEAVFPLPDSFNAIGTTELLGLPVPVWIAIAAVVAGQFVLSRTVYGRRLYAVGNNERAAFFAGVPITRIRLLTFTISGLLAAAGGILVAARISSGQVNSGFGLELTVIAAVIIGGTSLFGGSGSVIGTLVGCLLISVITNGMVLSAIDPNYQNIVVGGIIVIAVAIDGWRRRRLAAR